MTKSGICAVQLAVLTLASDMAASGAAWSEELRLSRELTSSDVVWQAGRRTPANGDDDASIGLRRSSRVHQDRALTGRSGERHLIGGETPAVMLPTEQKEAGRDRAGSLAMLNGGSRVLAISGAIEGKRALPRNAAAGGAVTLPTAVSAALAYSNEIVGAGAKAEADSHFATAAFGALLPRVELFDKVGDETSNPSAITDSAGKKVAVNKHPYRETTWQASQPLVDVPALYEYKRLRAAENSSQELYQSSRERVTQEVTTAFLRLIESRLVQVITDDYDASLKKLLEWTTLRSEAGASSETDSDRVRSRVVAAKASNAENQALLESARIQFRRLTGLDPATVEIPVNLLPVLPSDVESALEKAFAGNRDLLAALSDTESVEYEKKGKWARLLPKFEFQYSDHRIYNAGGIAANATEQNSFPTQRDTRALLVMSFSLFNGGSDVNQARALAAKAIEARYRAAEIRRRLEERVLINYETLLTVRDRISAIREEIAINEKVVAAFNEQLTLANRSLLDILDAQQRVNDSKLQFARMIVSEATASYQLLNNLGTIGRAFDIDN